jgi:hypothetical protein
MRGPWPDPAIEEPFETGLQHRFSEAGWGTRTVQQTPKIPFRINALIFSILIPPGDGPQRWSTKGAQCRAGDTSDVGVTRGFSG